VGIFDRLFRRDTTPPPPPFTGSDVLVVSFGDAQPRSAELDEDVAVYREAGIEAAPNRTHTASELRQLVAARGAKVVHLVAAFDARGFLVDAGGGEVSLRELMTAAEQGGARLFICATGNVFEEIKDQVPEVKTMCVLTLLQRNRHHAAFLRGLLNGLARDPNFAMAYVKLAPQAESAQRGRPLPGTIAICPGRQGGTLVLWTEPQA
jgi:hypothetical protein